MRYRSRALAATAAGALIAFSFSPAGAQAWVPAARTGSVLLAYQNTDVKYHLFNGDMTSFGGTADGKIDMGQVRGQAIQLGYDYGITSRLAFNGSVAYVGSTYDGALPEDEMDDNTFNGTFQDAVFGLRYMLPWKGIAITPLASYTFPTHSYPIHGHTAVGKGNNSFNAGISLGRTLDPLAQNVWLQAGYVHQFVQNVEEWGLDVNEYTASAGWFPKPRLSFGGYYIFHDTNDGVDWYYDDFTSDVEEHHDQAAQTIFHRVGGSVGYQLNASAGMFVDVGGIVSGKNTHDGVSYTVGTTWNFLGFGMH